MKKIYLIIPMIALLFGCPLPWENDDSRDDIVEDSPYYESITFTNETDLDKRAFLVLTNYGSEDQEIPLVTVGGNTTFSRTAPGREILTSENRYPKQLSMPLKDNYSRLSNSSRSTGIDYDTYSVGSKHTFWLSTFVGDNYQQEFNLESRDTLLTTDSELELFIWVDTRDSIPTGSIEHINSEFKNIYRDMIAIFGPHWGTHNFNNIVSPNSNDIHILFTDIDNDQNSNSGGYVGGYFHGNKDAYLTTNPSSTDTTNISNQNLNLVMDSYLYFNDGDSSNWRGDSYNSASTLLTLIHEFQHLIHFYNKDIVNNTTSDFFVNEMFSMVAEDIFAKSYGIFKEDWQGNDDIMEEYLTSPDRLRVPEFNFFWDLQSSFNWDFYENNLNSYSMSYVMGAYIIRNYGIDFFTDYFSHSTTGKDGILQSLNNSDDSTHTTSSLLQNFGIAVINSGGESTEKGYRFNNRTGFNILGYNLVPINFFNTTYSYNASGSENNRLYDYNYLNIQYNAPFYPITTEELQPLTETEEKEFLKESNLYVNLGRLSSGAEVVINTFPNEDGSAPTISYTILTADY